MRAHPYKTIMEKTARARAQRTVFLEKTNPRSLAFQIATWFGSGLIVPAPGTWGTFGGLIFGCLLYGLTSPLVTALAAIALFGAGLWATRQIEAQTQGHDSSFIVIDEVVAILLVLACLPAFTTGFIIAGFLIFRIFDATKPWPINWLDRHIEGAAGVMLDDLMAALYTLLLLWSAYGFI